MRGRLADSRRHRPLRRAEPVQPSRLRHIDRVILTACGTSYHAGLGRRVPAGGTGPGAGRGGVRQRVPLPQPAHRAAAPWCSPSRKVARRPTPWRPCGSPSGWGTPDPGHLQRRRVSSIAREADGGVYLHAGPGDRRGQHQGVHLARCAVLTMLALYFGRTRHLSSRGKGKRIIDELRALPDASPPQALDVPRPGQERWPSKYAGARHQRAVPGPAVPVPGRAGGGVEAEGDQLHPRRGLRRRPR